jgi:hypothetical protein
MLPITKKSLSLPLIAAAFTLLFTACDDSTTGPDGGGEESQIETHTVADISTGERGNAKIAYYSLRENSLVQDSASTDWDIAFSRTTIYTNSEASGPGEAGAIVLDQSFDGTTQAPSTGFAVDTSATSLAIPTGSSNGWYNYNRSTHLITPIEDKTTVLRTADGGHYAKLKILSYYKGNPDLSSDEFANNAEDYPSGHYTFEYSIQLNGTRAFTEE